MYVKYLQLLNYRNYEELFIELSRQTNVFIGDNAQGKTNILESIYYCSLGKSHRTNKDKELVRWGATGAHIMALIENNRLSKKIEIKIFQEGKKAINVNSIKLRKISELLGSLNVVVFSPEDLAIIKDSPSHRRKFMDIEISQLSPKYYHALVQYNKVLAERNSILRQRNCEDDIIDVYDMQLVEYGAYLIEHRIRYIDKLNEFAYGIHSDITSHKEKIEFKYNTSIKALDNIKQEYTNQLRKNRDRDKDRGVTTVGPHKDDIVVMINDIDAKAFGSQGQQRTAVLTLKLSSLEIIKNTIGEYPVLLLDDVLSELDFSRKEYILGAIKDIQTIITCTGIEDVKKYLGVEYKVFNVKDGIVTL